MEPSSVESISQKKKNMDFVKECFMPKYPNLILSFNLF